jgi:hypothetical protein
MKHHSLFIGITLSMLTLSSCSETPKTEQKVAPPPVDTIVKKVDVIEIDSTLTRMSTLLASLDTIMNYSHPQWDIAAMKSFARETDAKYKQMCSSRLEKMAACHTGNMSRANVSDSSFAFYPFSGGDFIHLRWLYPNASDYLMVAREEVGSYPEIKMMSSGDVMTYLQGIDLVLRDIYSKSYFITKNMISDIHTDNRVDGMLPILIWGAAKTNLEICSIDFFNIDSLGNNIAATGNKCDGVVLRLKDPESNRRKSLTYLSADISDKGFASAPGVKKYLDKQVPAGSNTFVKSASYLMHYGSFDDIRNMVLDKSNCLIQDDTGVPFKYFNQEIWNVQLLGEYEMPVKDFSSNLFQNDLSAAYQDSAFYKGPINFSLGYHWGSGNQNQMFSYKKNQIR